MQLLRLSSNDSRFKTVNFRPGLNLVVTDRIEESTQGESRNSTGKTSLVMLLRYLLGGNLPGRLNRAEFESWVFRLDMTLPGDDPNDSNDTVSVSRTVASPRTRVDVTGWSRLPRLDGPQHLTDWKKAQERFLFGIGEGGPPELTCMSLWGYFLRDSFGRPTKAVVQDPDWLVGLKLGYLFGLAPDVLAKSGQVVSLERQRKALNDAIAQGALSRLGLDEAELRAELAATTQERVRQARLITDFRVDERYEANQLRANELTQQIRAANEQLLALQNRSSELDSAIENELSTLEATQNRRLGQMYEELGVLIPDAVSKRFDDVVSFHASVVRNREQFLRAEREEVAAQIDGLRASRAGFDEERSSVMSLLTSSVAFDTFMQAQARLSELDGRISDLRRRLETANEIGNLGTNIRTARLEAERDIRAELKEREEFLVNGPLGLFSELGSEIYNDRTANLLLSSSKNGGLTVSPSISGDESEGIKGVETFLLDLTLAITSKQLARSPGLLVHDSHLFDSVDHRQVSSCLNIGARLADEHGLQYVVTMNSDFLASVEAEGGFDSSPYVLDVGLTDKGGDGGLFGFRFD